MTWTEASWVLYFASGYAWAAVWHAKRRNEKQRRELAALEEAAATCECSERARLQRDG